MAKEKAKLTEEHQNPEEDFSSLADYSFEINKRKIELYELWQDVFDVCRQLVDMIKLDPASVKASMLSTVVRLLTQSQTILDKAEKFRDSIKAGMVKDSDDLPASEVEDEELSPEEARMLEEFEKLSSGSTKPEEKPDELGEPTTLDDDLKHGFNFRRSK